MTVFHEFYDRCKLKDDMYNRAWISSWKFRQNSQILQLSRFTFHIWLLPFRTSPGDSDFFNKSSILRMTEKSLINAQYLDDRFFKYTSIFLWFQKEISGRENYILLSFRESSTIFKRTKLTNRPEFCGTSRFSILYKSVEKILVGMSFIRLI